MFFIIPNNTRIKFKKTAKIAKIMVLFNYNGNLALESRWLWNSNIISYDNYKGNVKRNKITVLHRSAPGYPAVISYEKLPYHIKNKVDAKLKELGEFPGTSASSDTKPVSTSLLESNIKSDESAWNYFSNFKLADGRNLTPETVTEYYNNAIILNSIKECLCIRKSIRNALSNPGSNRGVFASICREVSTLNIQHFTQKRTPLTSKI